MDNKKIISFPNWIKEINEEAEDLDGLEKIQKAIEYFKIAQEGYDKLSWKDKMEFKEKEKKFKAELQRIMNLIEQSD